MTALLYGAKGGNTASDLYTLNPANAAQTSVGPTGVAISGLAFDPTTGILWAATSTLSPAHPASIGTLNLTTGAFTWVADLTAFSSTGFAANDLCFDAAGQMYGWFTNNSAGDSRAGKINMVTGAVTAISTGGPGTIDGNNTFGGCLDVRPTGGLLWTIPHGATRAVPSGQRGSIWTVDPAGAPGDAPATDYTNTAVFCSGGPFTDNPGVAALKFDPDDDTIAWLVLNDFTPGGWRLATIAILTGAITNVGTLANAWDAIAWATAPAGPATKVAFSASFEPQDVCTDATMSPVKVRVEDALGVLETSSTAAVTVAIGTNPGGGTLSGTLTVNAVAGVATFSDLSIDEAGVGYTLTAASSGLTGATSSAFDVGSSPNDLCANATSIGGVSGIRSGNTTCAGKETPDALDAWWGTTVEHTVFFKYTAPADGYIEFTIDKPGGSTLARMVAGVLAGACGSQAVDPDALLSQESVRDPSFPAVIGHQVAAGDTVYVEIADDTALGGHAPGAYTLAWSLREIVYLDCLAAPVQVGPDLISDPDSLDVAQIAYCQDAAGDHWIAYWHGPVPQHLIVARLDHLALTWTSWTVYTPAGIPSDNNVAFLGINIATDGTKVWAACQYRHDSGGNVTQGIKVFEYGGGAWPLVGTMPGLTNNQATGAQFTAEPSMAADPNEPGVCYVYQTANNTVAGLGTIAKFDNTTTLWSNDVLAEFGAWSKIVNGGGAPVLFHYNFGNSGSHASSNVVNMSTVDPATGALTLLQSFDYATLGINSSAVTKWVNYLMCSSVPFLDPVSGVLSYYVGIDWGPSRIAPATEVVQVAADGSTPFDYFALDPAKALAPSGVADLSTFCPETNNVWAPGDTGSIGGSHVDQFQRQCGNVWDTYIDFAPGFRSFGLGQSSRVLVGDSLFQTGRIIHLPGFTFSYGVLRSDILRLGCFCALGPEVVIPAAVGPTLRGRFRVN